MRISSALIIIVFFSLLWISFPENEMDGAANSKVTLSDGTTYYYETFGNDFSSYQATIVNVNTNIDILYISTVLEGFNVTNISAEAFSNCDASVIVIPEKVKAIGSKAFIECSNLEFVYFLGDAPSMGADVFPTDVTLYCLADAAGWSKYSVSTIEEISQISPDGSIIYYYVINGEGMVSGGTPSIDGSIMIMQDVNGYPVKSIGPYSFAGHTNQENTGMVPREDVKKVLLSDGLTTIRERAFYYNTGIETIESQGVAVIMDESFRSASSLIDMQAVVNNADYIGFEAFRECRSLNAIWIPDSVIFVGEGAFKICTTAEIISIGSGIETISAWTFAYCSSATEVIFAGEIRSFGDSAFYMCSSIISIKLPNSVESIGSETFFKCTSMENITLGNSLKVIGRSAFMECSALNNVHVPETVSQVQSRAFAYCPEMTDIYFAGSMPSFEDNVFLNLDVTVHCKEHHKNSWSKFNGNLVIDGDRSMIMIITAVIIVSIISIFLLWIVFRKSKHQ